MSETLQDTPVENDFFQTGGTLNAGAPSYIERPADDELYRSVLAGDYCYVLTPRQMGKSSLMTRTAVRLRDEGVHVAVVDLTGIGGDAGSMTADQWYYGLANRLLRELKIALPLATWWKDQLLLPPLNRLMNFFEDVVLTQLKGNITVFVDEIDTTINLPFSDDFFAAIRACFNARANNNEFSRLRFVLLGVASPADLIRDAARTPFNIGKRIDLADFNDREARLFLQGLGEQGKTAEGLLARVLQWTNGQPYLTQRLCVQVQGGVVMDETPDARVDRIVAAEFLGVGRRSNDDNLKVINERIAQAKTERPALLKVYARVLKGKRVQDRPQSTTHSALKLTGLVKADERGHLVVRNRIYREVFNARWIKSLSPTRWKQRTALGALLAAAIVFGWWIGAHHLRVRSGFSILQVWAGIAYPEPEMVEIPPGSFYMGSPDNEKFHQPREGPRHTVNINRPFRLGKYEVTFDEYDVFALLVNGEGGCTGGRKVAQPSDWGWGRGDRPVIDVSWADATCYADWLSRKTGKNYRLPTEAEWEYAARAGAETPLPWPGGWEAACGFANVLDQGSIEEINKSFNTAEFNFWKRSLCSDGYPFTAPVGSFMAKEANPFGLRDMLGNVMEWTQDCWHEDYQSAPTNGLAWLEANKGDCSRRVVRSSSWWDIPEWLRTASRYGLNRDHKGPDLGFRLAQDQ